MPRKLLTSPISLIDEIKIGNTNLGQSKLGIYGNESVFFIPKISEIGASQSDAVLCYTQDTRFSLSFYSLGQRSWQMIEQNHIKKNNWGHILTQTQKKNKC